jgi:uncharacterized iron-regulated protein
MLSTTSRAGVLTIFVLSLVAGCASPERRDPAAPGPAALPDREAVRTFDAEGRAVAWSEMLDGLAGADVIVIGETHGQESGLAAAAALWEDIVATGADAALALEFFERDQQVALDDYLTGVTDEVAFLEASGRRGGNYPPGHRAMVERARESGRPVVAANAPRRYVRMTTPEGFAPLARLGPAQRRLFAIPEALSEGRYRKDFFSLMSGGGHGAQMPEGMVEKMYHSQQLWDETMADSVVNALNRGHRPVVLVVGRFHADFRGAVVEFIERRRPDVTVRTVSVVEADATELAGEDTGRADFVWYAPAGGGLAD